MEIKFENVTYINNITNNKILNNLSFNIAPNTITAFIGNSNSGKSTILKIIATLDFPSSGKAQIDNYIIESKNKALYELRKQIGIVYQNPEKQFFNNTVKQEIEFALNNYNYKNKQKRVLDSLKMVGFDKNYLDKSPFDLSSGEKKLLSLAISLAFNPKIIVLNEPTLGLDNKAKNHLIKLLKTMKLRYNKTIVIVSNDTDTLFKLADNVFLIDKGKLIKKDDKYTIFKDYNLLKKYDIRVPKTTYFSNLVKEKTNLNIGIRNEINDLIKDIYRYVK